ncbi:hypothetical protein PILCRDRAFT_256401 [Piloderma croceum F 1598]|uniref:Major facilitator superfamily (MFS) profile domain-containing protein n=1 Tax=Piloderma croceum (strain F 1598) TaxID=765440 RepID=A0A0C3GCP6_PILCF|nr:hypothetical protein PILCRDRAFT_256401 [Piloderma croceum F 1598]
MLVAGAVTCCLHCNGAGTMAWNDKSVIILFVFAGVISVALVNWEKYSSDDAVVTLMIFKSRSIYMLICYSFLICYSLLLFSYYVPIFYPAVKHYSATASGIDLLPFMLDTVLSVISAGQIVGRIGYLCVSLFPLYSRLNVLLSWPFWWQRQFSSPSDRDCYFRSLLLHPRRS